MTLPKITAARPLGSPGVVSPQLLAAPGSFEERHPFCAGVGAGLLIVGACVWAMPPLREARAATPSGLSQSSLASCQHRIAIAECGK
jgi:hypothetical protein